MCHLLIAETTVLISIQMVDCSLKEQQQGEGQWWWSRLLKRCSCFLALGELHPFFLFQKVSHGQLERLSWCLVWCQHTKQQTTPNLRLTQPLPLYVSTEKMISTASMCDRTDTGQKGDNAHSEVVYQAEQIQPF